MRSNDKMCVHISCKDVCLCKYIYIVYLQRVLHGIFELSHHIREFGTNST